MELFKKTQKKGSKKSKQFDIKYFLTIYFLTKTTQKCANYVDALLVLHFLISFSSSFIFVYFSHSIVQIWKMSKKIKKWRTSSASTEFVHFWVVLVRKYMVKKYLISNCFDFLEPFFCVFFNNSIRAFLYYLVKKESVILRSLSCFNPYFLL